MIEHLTDLSLANCLTLLYASVATAVACGCVLGLIGIAVSTALRASGGSED
jgi:hypothetical protein